MNTLMTIALNPIVVLAIGNQVVGIDFKPDRASKKVVTAAIKEAGFVLQKSLSESNRLNRTVRFVLVVDGNDGSGYPALLTDDDEEYLTKAIHHAVSNGMHSVDRHVMHAFSV